MAAHGKYSAGSGPLPLPKISFAHKWTAKLLGATMWFWIFYRVREVSYLMSCKSLPVVEYLLKPFIIDLANQDMPVTLGWRKPWEHGHHGAHENHEGHATSPSHEHH
jgi:hypothetical protein